jgi:hypothetical protein
MFDDILMMGLSAGVGWSPMRNRNRTWDLAVMGNESVHILNVSCLNSLKQCKKRLPSTLPREKASKYITSVQTR